MDESQVKLKSFLLLVNRKMKKVVVKGEIETNSFSMCDEMKEK